MLELDKEEEEEMDMDKFDCATRFNIIDKEGVRILFIFIYFVFFF